MTQQIIKRKSLKEIKESMEVAIQKSHSLILKNIDETGFHVLSRKNYGIMSMIEKDYYQIKGKFKKEDNQTTINYEVKPNATFRVLSIVLPIMMLPTLIFGFIGEDEGNILTGLLFYLLPTGLVVFWTLYQEKNLKLMGEKDFELLLEKINP